MRAVRLGVMAALDDSPRPGRAPDITAEARARLVSLACQKAKGLGYPHELWTTQLLASHARAHSAAAGHPCLAGLAQGTVCKILARHDVKPHNVRYYLERRDEDFETKMAEILCVCREVAVLRQGEPGGAKVAVISCDEKPGIQAIGSTAPDLPPEPGRNAAFARDHEYKRYGTLSLLAGIDLLTGESARERRGPAPFARVHRLPQEDRCRLSRRHRDQAGTRQSFSACIQGNKGLACNKAGGTFLVRLYAETRVMAQPGRRLLL